MESYTWRISRSIAVPLQFAQNATNGIGMLQTAGARFRNDHLATEAANGKVQEELRAEF